MNIKNVSIVLLIGSSLFLDARWVVSKIDFSDSDLSSEKSTAYYGSNSALILEPLTNLLRENAATKKIEVPSSIGDVGKDSLGFNKFTLHDSDGNEYAIFFDGQNAFRLQQGRVKAAALNPELGRYNSSLDGFVARAEVRENENVIHSHVQSHINDAEIFCMVISGTLGDYSLILELES
jgi:hypothetical protein